MERHLWKKNPQLFLLELFSFGLWFIEQKQFNSRPGIEKEVLKHKQSDRILKMAFS